MKDLVKRYLQTKTFYWNLFLFLLVIWLIAFRFLIIQDLKAVHYHADFQIYLQGELLSLDLAGFYEEVTLCSDDYINQPTARAHLHDKNPHLIHIHDRAVTYSHFMANLGFHLSDKLLETHQAIYRDGEAGQLRFILNGYPVLHLANRVIESQDVVLIDFSNDPISVLKERYQAIPRAAAAANQKQDPQGCFGEASSDSIWQRFKKALSF